MGPTPVEGLSESVDGSGRRRLAEVDGRVYVDRGSFDVDPEEGPGTRVEWTEDIGISGRDVGREERRTIVLREGRGGTSGRGRG